MSTAHVITRGLLPFLPWREWQLFCWKSRSSEHRRSPAGFNQKSISPSNLKLMAGPSGVLSLNLEGHQRVGSTHSYLPCKYSLGHRNLNYWIFSTLIAGLRMELCFYWWAKQLQSTAGRVRLEVAEVVRNLLLLKCMHLSLFLSTAFLEHTF